MSAELALIAASAPWEQVGSIIASLVGGGILTAAVKYRLSGAQKETIGNAASNAAVDVFRASIKQLKDDLADARTEADEYRAEVLVLRDEIRALRKALEEARP